MGKKVIPKFKANLIPFSKPKDKGVPDLGFHFTPEDNYRIMVACINASEWIKGFGKGRQPYSIDLRNYENTISNDKDSHLI